MTLNKIIEDKVPINQYNTAILLPMPFVIKVASFLMFHYASYNISENMSEVLNHISGNACGFYFLVQNADTL